MRSKAMCVPKKAPFRDIQGLFPYITLATSCNCNGSYQSLALGGGGRDDDEVDLDDVDRVVVADVDDTYEVDEVDIDDVDVCGVNMCRYDIDDVDV